jgi:hypothetical protein
MYNHLPSLRAVRVHVTKEKKRRPKGCCGKRAAPVKLTDDIVQAVIANRHFKKDLAAFKKMHGLDTLIVNLGQYRTTV